MVGIYVSLKRGIEDKENKINELNIQIDNFENFITTSLNVLNQIQLKHRDANSVLQKLCILSGFPFLFSNFDLLYTVWTFFRKLSIFVSIKALSSFVYRQLLLIFLLSLRCLFFFISFNF
jgi:hypothetical protein